VDYYLSTFVSDAVATARLETGIRRGSLNVALYADNLFDSRDILQATHNSKISANMRYVIVRPRTVGLRFTYNFD
jgi:hypothetical protein